jgi:hypothetical protein
MQSVVIVPSRSNLDFSEGWDCSALWLQLWVSWKCRLRDHVKQSQWETVLGQTTLLPSTSGIHNVRPDDSISAQNNSPLPPQLPAIHQLLLRRRLTSPASLWSRPLDKSRSCNLRIRESRECCFVFVKLSWESKKIQSTERKGVKCITERF